MSFNSFAIIPSAPWIGCPTLSNADAARRVGIHVSQRHEYADLGSVFKDPNGGVAVVFLELLRRNRFA